MPTHAEKRLLRYTPEQMFALVADVRRYPEFLPWCVAARVISQDETALVADLTIGFKLFRETFRSQVTLDRPGHVHVVLTGRRCPPEIIALADTVTEMTMVKHAFQAGIPAQRGIED